MTKNKKSDTNQQTMLSGNYASRLLSRVMNERKKADSKLTVAEAAKLAVDANQSQEKTAVASTKN